MCGVPVHSAEAYLARLIRGGHRVAIAEQIESPAEARKARGSKALVDRAIVRLVTPGTLTEEALLESAAANWLAAVGRAGDDWAIAAADISTGRFELIACGPGELAAELARLSPAETIADGAGPGHRDAPPARAASTASPASARSRAASGWRRSTGSGAPSRAELAAAGGLLAYLDATQKGAGDPARRAAADRAVEPYGDRRGDPREPRADPLGRRQRRRQPARRDRPLPDRGRAPAAAPRTLPRR